MSDGRNPQDGGHAGPEDTVHRPDPELSPPGGVDAGLGHGEPEYQRGIDEVPEGADLTEGREAGLWSDAWKVLRRNPFFIFSGLLIVGFLIMALWPSVYTTFYPGFADPNDCQLSRSLQRPGTTHWFGFDLQGCDLYTRTIYGARASILISFAVVVGSGLIAVVFGSIAGYYGRWTDAIIARITDIWFGLPLILAAIAVLSALGHSFFLVTLVIVLFAWPTMLRLMRSSVLAAKEDDYVEAARALGASDLRIIFKHILPNAITPVIVYATIFIGIVISVEATLSYLGVGLQLPAISWGLMINSAQYRILQTPYLLIFPATFLGLAVLSFILMGDVLRDAFDPKQR